MANSPTIVSASLDDKEMRQSIANLVAYVKRATRTMSGDLDSAVEKMNASLKKLGTPASGGGSANTSNTKRDTQAVDENTNARKKNAQATKEQTQENKEFSMTFDQMANAQKKAIESQYKLAFSRANKIPTDQYDLAQAKLERLQALLIDMRKLGILSPSQIASTEVEIRRLEQLLRNSANEQQQLTQNSQRYTEEIRRQAQAIRESQQWKERGEHSFVVNKETGTVAYIDAKSKLSIEEQLLKIYELEAASKSQLTAIEQQENSAAQTQLSLEQAITSEVEKRKKAYSSPTTTTYASPTTDMLRKFIADKAGVSVKDVKIFDETTASASKLTEAIKQVQTAYSRLTADERNNPYGKALVRRFQELQREYQKTQSALSRPTRLKDVLSLDEKSLDDIAYKMRQLQAYRQGMDISNPQNERTKRELTEISNELDKLKKKQTEILGSNENLIKSNTALGRSWNYMKNRLAFYFTVGASTQFVKSLIDIRGQYELLERSIGILIDSAQNGSRIFAELNAMAIKSPFTTMELGAAAKQLVAYDVAAKDVVDTTKRLADMAAAVGVPIERLTYALGQIKSYSYLNARDARMFANTGIPLVKELADMYTRLEGRLVSTADVYDRIKHKMVSYEDVMKVVNEMTDEGGKFFNFQEKAADTLKVKIANLTLAYNNMMNEMGKDSQGVVAGALNATKQIFEHWRDINNLLASIVSWIGIYKTGMLVVLTATSKTVTATRALAILQTVLGQKVATNLASIGTSFMKFVSNPAALASVAISGLAIWLGKAAYDFYDLKKANEAFNKSVVDGAEENIKSIDKFFKDYRKDLESIGAANESDQQKVWERMREEIEKTIKNAQQYIDVLNEIQNVADRIGAGKAILEQQQEIEKAAKDLASRGVFDLGGGFADSSLAKNLKETESLANDLIKTYGSLNEAEKKIGTASYTSDWRTYQASIKETDSELENFVSKLDKANINKIMGSGDAQTQFANIRNFATIIRDAFLATEEGSKVGYEGQARLNAKLDEWIAKQGQANGIIEERTINGRKYTADEIANIESQRSAWEKFFDSLSASEKKRLDYAVKTNQTSSEDVKDIWDKAAKEMSQNETTAYNLIQDHIAQLRNTPDIVLNVIYRESTQKEVDPQRRRYQERFIEPQGSGVLAPDKYFDQVEENTRKFGRFIKKEGEDNVEWEKRLGQEYQDNEKSLKSLNNQLKDSAKLSDVDRKAKEKERDTLKDQQVVLETIRKEQGFNFDQFKKGGKGSKKDILGDALSKEVQLITDIRKRYEEYKKMGVDTQTALTKATEEYGVSLKSVKNTLSKFGIAGLDGIDVANMEMRDLVQKFEDMKKTASLQGNVKGVEALEKAIASLNVEITKVDYKKITDGLNNELGKLKDEYELAVELDANPELGDMFADYFGINLKELPKDYEQALRIAQKRINTMLKENPDVGIASVDVEKLMSRSEFDSWVKSLGKDASSELIKSLANVRSWLYKVRSDETKKQIQEWDKMLEKYAEYEYKKKQITEDYEKETATALKMGANASVLKAIENRRDTRYAELDFSEFMKTPEWITATGNLAGMSKTALDMLIDRINKYKKTAKYLSPKQIKELNKALKQLHAEQKKNNPFKAISNMLAEAKERMQNFDKEIEDVNKEIGETEAAIKSAATAGQDTSKQTEALEKLKERLLDLNEARKEAGKFDASEWVGAINETVTAVQAAVGVFNDLAKAIGGINSNDIDKVFGVLEKAGSSAAIGAAIGGGYGAVIGAVVGAATSIISWIAGSSNERITAKIEDSERAVKRLENAMLDLQDAADHAYGAMTSGAKRAIIANKELQLVELKRQIQLEKSRDSKDKDESKIIELEGQYKQMLLDIKNGIGDIVNEMLGVSSAGDAITQLVEAMVEAFRNGEDAMEAFGKKWDEMIDNMILKLIVSEYMQKAWDKVMENLNKKEEEFLAKSASDKAWAQNELYRYESMSDWERGREYAKSKGMGAAFYFSDGSDFIRAANAYMDSLRMQIAAAEEAGEQASGDFLKWSLDYMMGEGRDYMTQVGQSLADALGEWYTFGQDKDSALSALQQGIQGITEDTAGAIEAYLNIVSQHIFIHTDLLTEIRDSISSIDFDAQLGVQSQMLLQLQDSYTVQKSIESILSGVLNPSGRAFSVELIS